MLNQLYYQQNLTRTENGSRAFNSTGSACLDFFALAGALRNAENERIIALFTRAVAENQLYAVRTLFYARDIREGLGERGLFRICLEILAEQKPQTVKKLLPFFAEYGRYDDLLLLLDSPCCKETADFLKNQLNQDIERCKNSLSVSLLAKWLPSVNTSSTEAKNTAKKICRLWHISEKEYRKTLSELRRQIDIVETHICEKDYSFNYSSVPGKAFQKYRKAFIRNDKKRFEEFLESVEKGNAKMNAGTIYPYELVNSVLSLKEGQGPEELSLETAWNSLPDYTNDQNVLVVVDGSGSMYSSAKHSNVRPIDVAISLGMYFAERNEGAFKDSFITFSEHPRLVKIPNAPFADRVRYCMSYNEIANTDLYQVFMLILVTAVKNNLPQSELPSSIYIISDMEFDSAVNSDAAVYKDAAYVFKSYGYSIPNVVFWNVNSHSNQFPIDKNENGTLLVSGCSPNVFRLAVKNELNPEKLMYEVLNSERYAKIVI